VILNCSDVSVRPNRPHPDTRATAGLRWRRPAIARHSRPRVHDTRRLRRRPIVAPARWAVTIMSVHGGWRSGARSGRGHGGWARRLRLRHYPWGRLRRPLGRGDRPGTGSPPILSFFGGHSLS
jgi:hypothetical protein